MEFSCLRYMISVLLIRKVRSCKSCMTVNAYSPESMSAEITMLHLEKYSKIHPTEGHA